MSLDVVRTIEIFDFLRGQATIDKSKVLEWKKSEDEDVLQLLFHAITYEFARIQPSLSRAEYGDLLLRVFAVMVRRKAEKRTPYALSPYEIGYLFACWATEAIGDSAQPENIEVLNRGREVLGALYQSGDESQRRIIVNGTLEHLFENAEIRQLFAGWQTDVNLLPAFEVAREWAEYASRKRSILNRVAERAAQYLNARNTRVHKISEPQLGTDTAAIEFDEPNDTCKQLVIDCDDELVEYVKQLDGSLNPKLIEKLARYAAEPAHWTKDEHTTSQLWVTIPRWVASRDGETSAV